MAAGFDRSENSLVVRGCFARTDRRVCDQHVILLGNCFELIEQSGGFLSAFLRRLGFLQPLIAFGPELPFFHVNNLLRTGGLARSKLTSRVTNRSQKPSPNKDIDEDEQNASNDKRHHALTLIHSQVGQSEFLYHRGFPSKRNWA